MIEGNVIKFGYGTVGCSSVGSVLRISHIKPPQEIGHAVNIKDPSISIEATYNFGLSFEDVVYLKKQCGAIASGKIEKFEFMGMIFDFSHYNIDSIGVLYRKIDAIEQYLISLMAV